jgi:hypothetical protein
MELNELAIVQSCRAKANAIGQPLISHRPLDLVVTELAVIGFPDRAGQPCSRPVLELPSPGRSSWSGNARFAQRSACTA